MNDQNKYTTTTTITNTNDDNNATVVVVVVVVVVVMIMIVIIIIMRIIMIGPLREGVRGRPLALAQRAQGPAPAQRTCITNGIGTPDPDPRD